MIVALLVTAAAAAVVASASLSTSGAGASRVACAARSVTLLLWPNGHPAIPSVGFGAFPPPHMEVYRTGATYPSTNFLAYLGSDGKFSLARSCRSVAAPLIHARIASPKVERSTMAVACKLVKPVQLDAVQLPGGTRLLVVVPPKTIAAVATIKPTGVSATYNSALCTSVPAPS